jgi:hypothetical protein
MKRLLSPIARMFVVLATLSLPAGRAEAQTVLFDFDTAPLHSPLPISLTVGGITANFTATGQGFSIQRADTMGFTPINFSGFCIYPSSVYLADLHVGFSVTLTEFSILYAPSELDCDSSATLRVTAYLDGAFVGTSTTNAQPGTWPSETLAFNSTNAFNSVVVHYDQPPVTGGDWGPIFMADNMQVTPAPPPPVIPVLQLTLLTDQIQLAWPTNAVGFALEANAELLNPAGWTSVTNEPIVVDTDCIVTLPLEPSAHFYRLKKP